MGPSVKSEGSAECSNAPNEKGLSGNFGQVKLEKKEEAKSLSDVFYKMMLLNPV